MRKTVTYKIYYLFPPRKLTRKADGGLAKESALELFGLNHNNGPTKSERMTEEILKAIFQERCKKIGNQLNSYLQQYDEFSNYWWKTLQGS